jgi:hypothetical protein
MSRVVPVLSNGSFFPPSGRFQYLGSRLDTAPGGMRDSLVEVRWHASP